MMARPVAALLTAGLLGAWLWAADDSPLEAGRDVPPPATRKVVEPTYPATAHEAGVGGIVIVEIVIDEEGNVASAEAIRSIPGLDDAALEAVRQWKYEVTRVDGQPVRVRHVVPITFTRRLPHMRRQRGIPELRQGSAPRVALPSGGGVPESAGAAVELILAPDGSVSDVSRLGGEGPWLDALVAAVREWRFASGSADERVSFRVIAHFVNRGRDAPRVELELTGLRVSSLDLASPPPAPAATPEYTAADEGQAAIPDATEGPVATDQDAPVAEAGNDQEIPDEATPEPPSQPDVEVITAPTIPPLFPTTEPSVPGSSSLANVSLGIGVPDLVSGRQPLVPPLARIDRVSGSVEVVFSVDVSGRARVHGSTGHERLTPQAEGAVASWLFRRTTTDRLFMVARFDYGDDGASASVELRQEEP